MSALLRLFLQLDHSENFKSFTWKNVLNSSKRLLSGSNVVDIEKVFRNDTFFKSAIPHSPYHKEEGLWVRLAESNDVWFFQKVSFMDEAKAIHTSSSVVS
ncbi:hypothetical protein YC2023_009120 [Brassica napus]